MLIFGHIRSSFRLSSDLIQDLSGPLKPGTKSEMAHEVQVQGQNLGSYTTIYAMWLWPINVPNRNQVRDYTDNSKLWVKMIRSACAILTLHVECYTTDRE